MAIAKTTELAAVSASRRFGEPPKFQRQFVVEVTDPTTTQTDISNATPVSLLDGHPEASYCKAFNVSVANYNNSRWHYLVTWDYELPKQSNPQPNPLDRPDIWKFTTSGVSVPALYYYDNANNLKTLTNTAGDFWEGATTDISQLKAHISANRASYDFTISLAVTNALNNGTYLGFPAYTWKCEGISAQPAVEVVNEVEVRYWQIEVELTMRPDGHPLILPNVGWNYVQDGQRRRVWVWNEEGTEKIPASNPQPLDENGMIVTVSPGEANPPLLLSRRVHKAVNFTTYFGSPS